MEIRATMVALATAVNAMIEAQQELAAAIEEFLAESDDGETKKTATKGRKRTAAKDDDDDEETETKKPARRGRAAKKEEEEEEDDAPTEADVVKAVRAAQKIIDKPEIAAILKKHGKAARASEVDESRRQAVIDALEAACEE